MHLFIEKERGGISYIAKRHCSANNNYMQPYDVIEPSRFVVHFDANNLYCLLMSQYLPYGGFKKLNKKK